MILALCIYLAGAVVTFCACRFWPGLKTEGDFRSLDWLSAAVWPVVAVLWVVYLFRRNR